MLLPSAFSKQISTVSLEECVLVFKVCTTATRKLRVKGQRLYLSFIFVCCVPSQTAGLTISGEKFAYDYFI